MQVPPKRKRWLEAMITAAQSEAPAMPWQRGTRRKAFASARQKHMTQAA